MFKKHEQVCQCHHDVCNRLCCDAGSDVDRFPAQGNSTRDQLGLHHRHGRGHRCAGHSDSARTAEKEPRKADEIFQALRKQTNGPRRSKGFEEVAEAIFRKVKCLLRKRFGELVKTGNSSIFRVGWTSRLFYITYGTIQNLNTNNLIHLSKASQAKQNIIQRHDKVKETIIVYWLTQK